MYPKVGTQQDFFFENGSKLLKNKTCCFVKLWKQGFFDIWIFSSDGLGGIGMGLGPGGQPIDANHLNKGMGMGNMGPGGKKITPMLCFMRALSCVEGR